MGDSYGIVKKIPMKNKVKSLDGKVNEYRVRVSDIKVNDDYSISKESQYKLIKINKEDYKYRGFKNYEISYLYDLGKDKSKEHDELYFNIIGNEWDTTINNVTFTIIMPKEFDSSKLKLFSGGNDSTDSSDITYNIDGRIINGKYNGTLKPHDELTVRLELPNGYFINTNTIIIWADYIMFIVPIITLLIAYLIWKKYTKGNKTMEIIESYPIEELNSLEVGILYNKCNKTKCVASLLIYLANKGYIKITETNKGNLTIVKLKEYVGINKNEEIFLDGLFLHDKAKTTITKNNLKGSFYLTIQRIASNIKRSFSPLIYEKKSKMNVFLIVLCMFITLLTIIVIPTLEYSMYGEFGETMQISIFIILFICPAIIFLPPGLFKVFFIIWPLFALFLGLSQRPFGVAIKEPIYLISVILGLIYIIIMFIFIKTMKKRTKYGSEMFDKIKEFKKFLETAKKDKLEAIMNENPNYFYDMLPYAYVLGLSNKWIKKFEDIPLKMPSWYEGKKSHEIFSSKSLNSFMNLTMLSIIMTMSSRPLIYFVEIDSFE